MKRETRNLAILSTIMAGLNLIVSGSMAVIASFHGFHWLAFLFSMVGAVAVAILCEALNVLYRSK